MNKHVIKVVGTHAAINGLLVAGATILFDAYKLVKAPATAAAEAAIDTVAKG